GPVDAELTIDGVKQQVAGAWVVVGLPDFVPPIHSYRTMYDSLVDVIVREMDIPADDGLFAGPLAHIAAMSDDWKRNKTIKDFSPSFTRDIAPILSAIARLERVHQHQMGPRARFHGSIAGLNFNALGGPGSLKRIATQFSSEREIQVRCRHSKYSHPRCRPHMATISKQQMAEVTQMIPPICIQFPNCNTRCCVLGREETLSKIGNRSRRTLLRSRPWR